LLISLDSCHDLDVKIPTLLAILLALASSALAADCPKNQPKTEAALIELEQNWAAALSRKDAASVACMVADEFEDADVDGSLHTRSQTLEHVPNRKPGVNHLSEMRAHVDGSAAAPTAGLHFTADLLQRLADSGVGLGTLVLHVGLDTFRPVTHADPATHQMHREWYTVPADLQAQIHQARSTAGRIVAVGTTSVRALESWAATGNVEGWTDLFIVPGHRFAVVDALITNFHLPRSTLLMLVSAFAGRERVLAAYADAIGERYRFYSFGDAMLVD
jgi:hypothetical protein